MSVQINVGEVWGWRDEDVVELIGEDAGSDIYLILRTMFCHNDAAVEMMSLITSEVVLHFPYYDMSRWRRIT